jgi:hypothetical protein
MGGVTHVFYFIFWVTMNHFDWPITKKTIPWRFPKLEISIGGWSAFPLDEKKRTLGKVYGIKV